LGANWVFEPGINYYRVSRGLSWLKQVNRNTYDTTGFDYFYIFTTDPFTTASKIELDTIRKFESTILLRKKK
jgi:hypothetical protein